LSRPLVLASCVVDDLETVVRHVGLEVGCDVPDVGAGVGDLLDDGVERQNVLGRAAEEDDSHGALGGWSPGDGIGLAGGDSLIETGFGNWITRRAGGRSGVGRGESREASSEECESGAHLD